MVDRPVAQVVIAGDQGTEAQELPLSQPELVIGRSLDSDIVVDDMTVARRHALLRFDNEENAYTLADLESANGTYLNGRLLHGVAKLGDGDRIGIGRREIIYRILTQTTRPPNTVENANTPINGTPASDVAVREGWGDILSEERQAELETLYERQKAWVAQPAWQREKSVLAGVHLSGADVFWLATRMAAGQDESGTDGFAKESTNALDQTGLHLEGVDLEKAYLEGAKLPLVHLDGAILRQAHLQGAILIGAHLERARLRAANLESTRLDEAHLQQANLDGVSLKSASLTGAHLEGVSFDGADLEGANLQSAFFDAATNLTSARFGAVDHPVARVADLHWGDTNLSVVDWSSIRCLGDEDAFSWASDEEAEIGARRVKRRRKAAVRLERLSTALRANRQFATVLRSQGLNEDADRFSYRAQVLHRHLLRHQGRLVRTFGSLTLDWVAGYGYKPMRSVFTYLFLVLAFGAAYFGLSNFGGAVFPPVHTMPLTWPEALVLSISSFHGRGLFPPGLSLGDSIAILAAAEAVVGLLTEIIFIATFTQRFFAR